jgi:capsular polysaccharide biosynthesis protein
MELRQYWKIFVRRWWIIAFLLAVVVATYAVARPKSAPVFQATMRFAMGLEPEPKNGAYYSYDKYYTWLTAEYLTDDVAALVRSQAFAQAVSQRVAADGIQVPAGAISGATQSGKQHRILSVSIVWGDERQLTAIADAVAAVLPGEIARDLAQVGTSAVQASLIDPPAVSMVGAGLRERLDLPIRLFLAIASGLILIFLLHYLDDALYSAPDLEECGIAVLAEIPSSGRKRLRLR